MKSIVELEKYLEEDYYSFTELTIGKHYAPEGYIIEQNGNMYEFCYSERGKKRVLKSFSNEQDSVEYTLRKLSNNKWNRAHLVAWVWNECEIIQAEQELKNNGIAFERNDILKFSHEKTAYRLFVFGRDIAKLPEFKNKYYKKNATI